MLRFWLIQMINCQMVLLLKTVVGLMTCVVEADEKYRLYVK